MVDVPLSLAYWMVKKQNKPVVFLKPTNKHIITELANRLNLNEAHNLGYLSVFVEILNSMAWISKHEKVGCKYCNKSIDYQSKPRLIDSLKTIKIGNCRLDAEEEYMAKRIIDITRLPDYKGKHHDILVPNHMVRGLIRNIYRIDVSSHNDSLTNTDYIRRLATDSCQRSLKNLDTDESVGKLAAILAKSDRSVKS